MKSEEQLLAELFKLSDFSKGLRSIRDATKAILSSVRLLITAFRGPLEVLLAPDEVGRLEKLGEFYKTSERHRKNMNQALDQMGARELNPDMFIFAPALAWATLPDAAANFFLQRPGRDEIPSWIRYQLEQMKRNDDKTVAAIRDTNRSIEDRLDAIFFNRERDSVTETLLREQEEPPPLPSPEQQAADVAAAMKRAAGVDLEEMANSALSPLVEMANGFLDFAEKRKNIFRMLSTVKTLKDFKEAISVLERGLEGSGLGSSDKQMIDDALAKIESSESPDEAAQMIAREFSENTQEALSSEARKLFDQMKQAGSPGKDILKDSPWSAAKKLLDVIKKIESSYQVSY